MTISSGHGTESTDEHTGDQSLKQSIMHVQLNIISADEMVRYFTISSIFPRSISKVS